MLTQPIAVVVGPFGCGRLGHALRVAAFPDAQLRFEEDSSGGRTLRKAAKTRRSYTILRPPAMKNGSPSAATLKAQPVTAGERADAALRATFVSPAAAVRSSGSTTAIV